MLTRLCLSIFILSFLFTGQVIALDEPQPGTIVQATVNEVIDLLTNENLSEPEKKEKAFDIVAEQINFTGMSRRILAINWKHTNDEQKLEFENLFKKILFNTYWSRIKNYNNEKVEYITGMIEGNRFATVDTVIISDKIEIPITYRMELVDGKWMAYDFLIESLSLVTSYRTEYRNVIKTKGVDGLLVEMRERLN